MGGAREGEGDSRGMGGVSPFLSCRRGFLFSLNRLLLLLPSERIPSAATKDLQDETTTKAYFVQIGMYDTGDPFLIPSHDHPPFENPEFHPNFIFTIFFSIPIFAIDRLPLSRSHKTIIL
jgi:hypothetical protein